MRRPLRQVVVPGTPGVVRGGGRIPGDVFDDVRVDLDGNARPA